MKIEKWDKPSFSIIGKEGSTKDGEGFIQELWQEANARFQEVEPLAKKTESGGLAGIWGAMSDWSRSFAPWEEDFTQGLYLAGIECREGAEAPEGWSKWTVPGFRYLKVEAEGQDPFGEGLRYLKEHGLTLAGAAQDFTDPQSGKSYQLFPIERL